MFNPILRNLHGIFDKTNPEIIVLATALYSAWESLANKRKEISLQRFLASASDVFLDEWGDTFLDERIPGEEDEDYRPRIIEHFKGRGVTRPGIKTAVDQLLSPQACTIIKWSDVAAKNELPLGYFELQLPLRAVEGFILEQSYLEQDTYLMRFDDIKILWDLRRIKELIDAIKPAEAEYKLTSGGEVL